MMLTLDNPTDVQRELQRVEHRIVVLIAELKRLEGERDRLVLMQTDFVGAHDRRFVGVR